MLPDESRSGIVVHTDNELEQSGLNPDVLHWIVNDNEYAVFREENCTTSITGIIMVGNSCRHFQGLAGEIRRQHT